MDNLRVKVEFGGGTELLFNNIKTLDVNLAADNCTIKGLIQHLLENHIKERPELFVSGDNIRPGILILVNDVDYEILGGHEYQLKANDSVLFISTLHGG